MEKLRFTGGDIRLSVSCIHVVYHCVTCRQLRLGKGGDSVRNGEQEVTHAGGERKSEEMRIHTLGKEDKKQKTEEERQGTKDRGRKDRERKTEV